ncbi:hypothetical protein VIGAN_08166000 [Vigna angularis var. angularis]|uniref:Uncharacterized protein n=1 Tax=Vigna angularis var. angularis TaxID=157739 RepID=A0A0S3SQ69_PHAAN|nr:hypothetical protein VIGAN_08166000 [Vigna angularis var. angularis]
MALFGFRYQSATISTYNTSSVVRSETVAKPFSPFVPKYKSGGYSDEYVGNKKLVPVGRRPYEYESDDEWKHERRTNPPHHASASPHQLDSPRSIPVTSPHSGHFSQPKPTATTVYADPGDYNTKVKYKPKPTSTPVYDDGYGTDYGDYNNKQRYKPKPTSGPVYNDGHGADYGDYNNKERYKPKPTSSPVYNDGYGADYGDYNNKERYKPKPTFSPVYNDGYGTDDGDYNNKERYTPKSPDVPVYYDGYGADCGDYNNKEGYKPKVSDTPVYNNGYGADYGDYSNKEGYKPIPKPSGTPVYNDGYGGDYGSYNNKEGYKPKSSGSPVKNNGYGDDYGTVNNKERSKPKPTESPVYNDGYGGDHGNYEWSKPKSIPVYKNNGYGVGGASPTGGDYGGYGNYPNKVVGPGPKIMETPKKGTPISKPMNDIDEAIELLKKEGAMINGNEKKMNLVDETEKLKKIATKAPESPAKGNSRFSSQRPLFNFNDVKRPDYGVIDHKEAERRFNGMTI